MNTKNLQKNFSSIRFSLFILLIALTGRSCITGSEKNNIVYIQEQLLPNQINVSPEYKISPSRSKAWTLASRSENGKAWRFIAIIALWMLIALILLVIMDEAPVTLRSAHLSLISAALLIVWAVSNYMAYSSVMENNWINISPELYHILKDLPGGLDSLFDNREVIR